MPKDSPSEFNKILGNKIKMLRQIKGCTQMELADHLEYESTGTISQIENLGIGMKNEKIFKAAEFFNVHPMVLMTPTDMSEEDLELLIDAMKLVTSNTKSEHYKTIKSLLKLATEK